MRRHAVGGGGLCAHERANASAAAHNGRASTHTQSVVVWFGFVCVCARVCVSSLHKKRTVLAAARTHTKLCRRRARAIGLCLPPRRAKTTHWLSTRESKRLSESHLESLGAARCHSFHSFLVLVHRAGLTIRLGALVSCFLLPLNPMHRTKLVSSSVELRWPTTLRGRVIANQHLLPLSSVFLSFIRSRVQLQTTGPKALAYAGLQENKKKWQISMNPTFELRICCHTKSLRAVGSPVCVRLCVSVYRRSRQATGSRTKPK